MVELGGPEKNAQIGTVPRIVRAISLRGSRSEPVLVASTMSLVVVATGAAAALVPHARAGRVDWRVGLTFGGLGAATVEID